MLSKFLTVKGSSQKFRIKIQLQVIYRHISSTSAITLWHNSTNKDGLTKSYSPTIVSAA